MKSKLRKKYLERCISKGVKRMNKRLKIILTLLFITTVITAFAMKSSFATETTVQEDLDDGIVVDEVNEGATSEELDKIAEDVVIDLPENTGGLLDKLLGIVIEYKASTPAKTSDIIANTRNALDKLNKLKISGDTIESWMEGDSHQDKGKGIQISHLGVC